MSGFKDPAELRDFVGQVMKSVYTGSLQRESGQIIIKGAQVITNSAYSEMKMMALAKAMGNEPHEFGTLVLIPKQPLTIDSPTPARKK